MNRAQKPTDKSSPLLQSIIIPEMINSSPSGEKKPKTFLIHKTWSPWDSKNLGKVLKCIKRDRRASKTSGHFYSTLKSFKRHRRVNQLPAFILLPIIRKKHLLPSVAYSELSDQLRPDVGTIFLSYHFQNWSISKNISCYVVLKREGRYWLPWVTLPEISRE